MILERETEFAALGAVFDDLGSSGGRVALIRGEAGIGKSALVRQFVSDQADRAHVLVGGCDDLFIPQPLGPFWDMARDEASLLEPLEGSDRTRLLGNVLDLLSRTLRPTIMTIEDTHWADEATLDAIKYIGRRIARTNGLLLLTYRDGEVDDDHPLRAVLGDLPTDRVLRISLGGLSLGGITEMIGATGLDAQDVMVATHGNPLLVQEMVSAGENGLGLSIDESVTVRVRRLSVAAQEMLKTLSVIPEAIPMEDAARLPLVDAERLRECERRGLLDVAKGFVGFRHDLIRRAIDAQLTGSERLQHSRTVLARLPAETHACLLIHCAVEANDIDRLIDLAPRSARYAAAMGSHVQAVEDFRELLPHLDRLARDVRGPILDEWAREELLTDNVSGAIELAEVAIAHYREIGHVIGESGALSRAAHYYENAGRREEAEARARQAIDVLGPDADGAALASALEVTAYLHTMAGNVGPVPELVERTLEAGGSEIEERVLIRVLNHRGIVENIANYPNGRASLDEAWQRASAAGEWYEESRALFNHAWAALESRDLPTAAEYITRSITSAARHELPSLEAYANALYARILELQGDWLAAEDMATDALDRMALSRMVALPIMGVLGARKGRPESETTIRASWEMATTAMENQRLAPAASAFAESAWILGLDEVPLDQFEAVMFEELQKGFRFTPGSIAFWLWRLGKLERAPAGIAEPYRLMIEGEWAAAAAFWADRGVPYERALALSMGDESARLEALGIFEDLGANRVAGNLRIALRAEGINVPRRKALATRSNKAGLTARQTEVLELLAGGLSNSDIADRLFVSHRTVENHVSAILMKLDARGRDAAVDAARELGLLTA